VNLSKNNLLNTKPLLHFVKKKVKIAITEASSNDDKDLIDIINHSSQATIFHTPEWNKLITNEFSVPHYTLIARRGLTSKGLTLKVSIPVGMYTFFVLSDGSFNRIVSPLRDSDSIYGGPITIDGESEEVIRVLITGAEKFISFIHAWRYIVVPTRSPNFADLNQKDHSPVSVIITG